MKLKDYIKTMKPNTPLTVVDESIDLDLYFELDKAFYSDKYDTVKLQRLLIDRLEVKNVLSDEYVSVDLCGLFDNPDIVEYAEKNVSVTYESFADYEDLIKKIAADVVYYIDNASDFYCGKMLEAFAYADAQRVIRAQDENSNKSYYLISVQRSVVVGDGYDFCVELDNQLFVTELIQKCLKEGLFERPEDAQFINSIIKIDKEKYYEMTGIPLDTYHIPVTYQVSGFVKVQGTSFEGALKNAQSHIDQLPFPDSVQYVSGSFEINYNALEVELGEHRKETLAAKLKNASKQSKNRESEKLKKIERFSYTK